ncbi:MAG: alanine racemase [Proteobacteria bacterium]|nr:alanine racemase [Pseudomonadota bacterium]
MQTVRVLKKTIDLAALRHNWQQIRRRANSPQLLAVVKSNAYGHSLCETATALNTLADGFAVVRLQDALTLRAADITSPIILLQGIFTRDNIALLSEHRLTPVIHSSWQLQALTLLPADAQLTVYLKINTGMNRLGFELEEMAAAISTLQQLPAIKNIILMTHFADADRRDGLRDALEKLPALRAYGLPLSLGNSAATLLHGDIGDTIGRVGIALYGASPAPAWHSAPALGLQPVMHLTTELIALRTLAAGADVGYGSEFTAPEAMQIGIASIGYGDGYPRGSGLQVAIGDVIVPIIGRVSMEMIALDLRTCPTAAIGDTVTLWGNTLTVDAVAANVGMITYDLLTNAKGEYRLIDDKKTR